MAQDTELEQLRKIGETTGGRNPVQESRFRELLNQREQNMPRASSSATAYSPMQILEDQRKQAADLAAKNTARENEFLDRFRGTVAGFTPLPQAAANIEQDLNLPDLRKTATQLTTTLKNLPQSITNRGRAASVNADRLNMAIAREVSGMQPAITDITSELTSGENQLTRRLALEQAGQQSTLSQLGMEYGFISDSIARQRSSFSEQNESQLRVLLQNMANTNSITIENLKAANELAKQKSDYELAKQYAVPETEIVTVGGRKQLIDSQTGEVIRDLGASGAEGGVTPDPNMLTAMGENNQDAGGAVITEMKPAYSRGAESALSPQGQWAWDYSTGDWFPIGA